jgi:hypothetical protein
MMGGAVLQEPRLCQHGPSRSCRIGSTVCEHVVSSWLALPEQAPGNANMTTTELSQAVESVAFMIKGEPRAVELRYLHGLLDLLTEWESTHPDEAAAAPLVTAIYDLVSTLVLNAEPGA